MNESLSSEKISVDSLVAQVADDFLERLSRGEQPEISEYARRYPQIADLIPQVLSTLQLMQEVPAHPSDNAAASEPAPFANGRLGDYRVLREVGRGGMGIVYEAEQISLGRRVALKVLPFASTLDDKQLQRFKNEAQAAAHLHHQNIVPVYAVGSEATVHYYAMQFIEGHSLASIICELRHPRGHEIAPESATAQTTSELNDSPVSDQLFLVPSEGTAAQTPTVPKAPPPMPAEFSNPDSASRPSYFRAVANLAIQAAEALQHAHERTVVHRDIKPANLMIDCQGKLWITDFGLARFQQNSGLTMTGDLLGTLRYMSPEQALGLNGQVDHRADIYGLGITLYELLTLEPAFASHDRQEVLRQIGADYIRRPRRFNKAVPVDLETIVLKAMEKVPESRYVTAQAMADDLRRFLGDRPIQAKRPRLAQRFAKWRRRHKALVWAGVMVMAIAVAATIYADVKVRDERQLKQVQEQKALVEKNKAQISEAIAQTRADEVHKQRVRSRQILNQVLVGLDAFVPLIENMWQQPEKREQAKGIVDRELHYLHITLANENDSLARPEAAKIYRRIAEIHQVVGERRESQKAYQTATALLEKLLADYSVDPEYKRELDESSPTTGNWLMKPTGSTKIAVDWRVQQPTAEKDFLLDLAATYLDLGTVLVAQGTIQEALPALQQSLACLNRYSAKYPPTIDYPQRMAAIQQELGMALEATGHAAEALKAYQKALAIWEDLLKKFPSWERFKTSREDTKHRLNHLFAAWPAI
ncbi:MAG: protein kinase domain-containing protein [Gemmataceae bacterium]